MQEYLKLCRKVLDPNISTMKENRTGVRHQGYQGDMCQYDLADGHPAVTTKHLYWKQPIAEMLGFLRGYDNAADFRKLGCKVWDANANENQQWLANPNRKGEDDLGEIYGVQARRWPVSPNAYEASEVLMDEVVLSPVTVLENGDVITLTELHLDQLKPIVQDLCNGIDNRREIVTHWNPGRMSKMALPPCHLLYQFGIQGDKLNLGMYQRSCDVPLGVPFNIAGYAWLLSVVAHISGLQPGVFTHFLWDVHAYENQLELLAEQVEREPLPLPKLWINPEIKTLEDLETWVTVDDFGLENYRHHPAIAYPFAV